ncbi:uncharacterized protein [Scyliorhinus torazame]|uniref:uncharacterized protein n=1 Tax=Scyliorhinus torazame TaxID=75743 RepID=UPI003B5BFA79
MEAALKPDKLSLDPHAPRADHLFNCWLRCFEAYLEASSAFAKTDADRLNLLCSRLDYGLFDLITGTTTYADAIVKLKSRYARTVNSIYARHRLASRHQQPGEPLSVFVRDLRALALTCNAPAVSAEQNTEALALDAFVAGIASVPIRQLLLTQTTLTLDMAVTMAEAQQAAYDNNASYTPAQTSYTPAHAPYVAATSQQQPLQVRAHPATPAVKMPGPQCYFCGQAKHPRKRCPARDATCSACGKKGHFANVCRSTAASGSNAAVCYFGVPPSSVPGSLFNMCDARAPPSLIIPGPAHFTPGSPIVTSGSPIVTSGSPIVTSGSPIFASGPLPIVTSGPSPIVASGSAPPPNCVTSGPPPIVTSGPAHWTEMLQTKEMQPPTATWPPAAAYDAWAPPPSPTGRSSDPEPFSNSSTIASIVLDQDRPHQLARSTMEVQVNCFTVTCLFDSGSTESFLHPDTVRHCSLKVLPTRRHIFMASNSQSAEVSGYCVVTLSVNGVVFQDFKFMVLPHLCAPALLGLDFQCHLRSLTLHFNGPLPPLSVSNPQFFPDSPPDPTCSLSTLRIPPPSLFANLTPDCKPVATKSRRYSFGDRQFIRAEIKRLLSENIIAPSTSPWRAQVVVVKSGEKHRMVIDYSQTINRYTLLDAYPLPRISDMVNQIAQYRVFSTIDLKSAYHQLPIRPEDRNFTAFEADGRLYHFLRVPFGVTNGVSVFQRQMDQMVDQNRLRATFPYLDNVTICGHNQQDHDVNLTKFLQTAKRLNLTYNEAKCVFGTTRLAILGYVVENGVLGPDPDRLRPLLELPIPTCPKELRRCLGLFAYYAQWVPEYADKARPLLRSPSFPLPPEACQAFHLLKTTIARAAMHAVDESAPFQVESDASDFALGATLNQAGRPIAFFSRTLQGPEISHSSVEKEMLPDFLVINARESLKNPVMNPMMNPVRRDPFYPKGGWNMEPVVSWRSGGA